MSLTMRRERDYFDEDDLHLLYIAKRLKEALRLEELLTKAAADYVVEPDTYLGGIIFRTERVGAFFYVPPSGLSAAREVLIHNGFRPWNP